MGTVTWTQSADAAEVVGTSVLGAGDVAFIPVYSMRVLVSGSTGRIVSVGRLLSFLFHTCW